MTVEQLNVVLLVSAVVLLVAVVAVRLSVRTGLPSLLVYVGIGVLMGEDGLGVTFDDAQLARLLGYAALVLILAEGGLTTSWRAIRPTVPAAAVLATVGSIVSVLVTAAGAWLALGHDLGLALLVAAIVSSTDAAAVFSVLRRVPLPPRVTGLLEAESGFNDAPIVILVVAFSEAETQGGGVPVLHLAGDLVYELALGAAVGLAVGRLGVEVLRRVALPASGLYPIAVMALAVGAYGAGAVLHASGFLATYLAALVLGNSHLPHRPATRGFAEGVAWMAQIGLFVMLGLLATPHQLLPAILPALVVGAVLLLVARPVSVLVSLTGFRTPLRDMAFMSWAGLRGAVPIVLATIPVVDGVGRSQLLFNVVFVLVVLLTLLQGPTLPWVARRLGLVRPFEARELDVDSSPLSTLGADLLQVKVPAGSLLHGVAVFELRLPHGAVISLIVRDGRPLVPEPTTQLRHGDELLVVAADGVRRPTEARLRAVSRGGRLATWRGEGGEE
ncbi:MAG: potassium/proton antiporter [Motilibacteraceae bacterium]